VISGNQDDDGRAVAVEDERLHDLAELAADGTGGVLGGRRAGLELFNPALDSTLAEKCGHALDRLWPTRLHARSVLRD
jgi:hypothetical protein